MATVAVVGAGAWGTALAIHAARMEHTVRLWAREPEVAASVESSRENTPFLPGFALPAAISVTLDHEQAVRGADLVILVPPSKFLRAVATAVGPALPPHALVAVASKGIEESSLKLMSDVLAEVLPAVPAERVAFLSGPTFAKEVAKGLPCDIVAASKGGAACEPIQRMLHAPTFRVYASADPVGVEVAGALKNVIAIAAGACDALDLGLNARAALLTRGLAEITRFGVALGADPLTFLGLAGMGDLVLTCTGELSRNRRLGIEVAKGVDPTAYVASQRTVAEGYYTAHAAYDLAQKLHIDSPIVEQVYFVLHRGRPLLEALTLLVTRQYKSELAGIR
ncbi:MAG TPA: NAD(P)H-dependent glycerol-3-phosphate dehydrogenase [Polyangiaceae bacterium]|nr:NAD(P)H-dependent glycerol-3-phosphate dehydrogenase [Polyangiaceae bacterium]